MENKEDLEQRMYFLVPYNISPIQQAIQAGHAMGEYALKYGRHNPNHLIWEFLEKWKTWIILNGGTTNSKFKMITGEAIGSLNSSLQEIVMFNDTHPDLGIETSFFEETDLNDALTAVCLIVDERVFNRKDYPDFYEWVIEQEVFVRADDKKNWDILKETYKEEIGEDIYFLKELLNTKKLA